MDNSFFYSLEPWYEVKGTDCCLVSRERMRLSADGSLGIGGGDTVIERYRFQTAEVAAICAGIFNRDMRRNAPSVTLSDVGITLGTGTNLFKMCANNREIFHLDQYGCVTKLDLPYLVWCWLRTTGLVRGAKALWKGWA